MYLREMAVSTLTAKRPDSDSGADKGKGDHELDSHTRYARVNNSYICTVK